MYGNTVLLDYVIGLMLSRQTQSYRYSKIDVGRHLTTNLQTSKAFKAPGL